MIAAVRNTFSQSDWVFEWNKKETGIYGQLNRKVIKEIYHIFRLARSILFIENKTSTVKHTSSTEIYIFAGI